MGTNIFNRKRAGLRAKTHGEGFENFFFHSCHRAGIYVIRFPNGCRACRTRTGIKFLPVKTPFDFILIGPTNKVGYVDTKTCESVNFQYSDCTEHQVNVLYDLAMKGFVAGYVVHFKKHNRVVFFSAIQLFSLKRRESLSWDEGKSLGDPLNLNLGGFV